MTSKKQIKFGALLQYLQMGLNIIITFVYTPIMLKYLGKAEHGIYSLSGSFISYLSLLTLGFSGAYLRFYSRYKANNDEVNIRKLNGLYLLSFSLMGIIALISGLLITTDNFMKVVFDEGLTQSEFSLAKRLMIILILNMVISFPTSVFSSFITSQEKFVFQKIVNMVRTVLSPALNIPLLLLGYRSFALVLVTFGLSLFTDALIIFFCFNKLHMGFIFHGFEKGIFKEVFLFSLFIAINQIIDQINWSTDRMVIARFKGTEEVSIYSIGAQINSLFISFSTAISSLFAPTINRIIANKENGYMDEVNRIFLKVGKIQFYIVFLIFTGFIFFGKFFILNWAGEGYENSYYIAIILMASVSIFLIQNLGIEIQRAFNKHQFRSIVYLISAIFNVVISIFLTQAFGGIGAAIGTFISLSVNLIIMNIFYEVKMGIKIGCFFANILRAGVGLIPPILFGILIVAFVKYSNLYLFALWILLYVIIYFISIFLFSFSKLEKKKMLSTLKIIGLRHRNNE